MNLIEEVHSEIKNRHLTDLELARYLYLKTCQVFSYDYRYQVSYDADFLDSIKYKKFDLKRI